MRDPSNNENTSISDSKTVGKHHAMEALDFPLCYAWNFPNIFRGKVVAAAVHWLFPQGGAGLNVFQWRIFFATSLSHGLGNFPCLMAVQARSQLMFQWVFSHTLLHMRCFMAYTCVYIYCIYAYIYIMYIICYHIITVIYVIILYMMYNNVLSVLQYIPSLSRVLHIPFGWLNQSFQRFRG